MAKENKENKRITYPINDEQYTKNWVSTKQVNLLFEQIFKDFETKNAENAINALNNCPQLKEKFLKEYLLKEYNISYKVTRQEGTKDLYGNNDRNYSYTGTSTILEKYIPLEDKNITLIMQTSKEKRNFMCNFVQVYNMNEAKDKFKKVALTALETIRWSEERIEGNPILKDNMKSCGYSIKNLETLKENTFIIKPPTSKYSPSSQQNYR